MIFLDSIRLKSIYLIIFFLGILLGTVLSEKLNFNLKREENKWLLRLDMQRSGFCPVCLQGSSRITTESVELDS